MTDLILLHLRGAVTVFWGSLTACDPMLARRQEPQVMSIHRLLVAPIPYSQNCSMDLRTSSWICAMRNNLYVLALYNWVFWTRIKKMQRVWTFHHGKAQRSRPPQQSGSICMSLTTESCTRIKKMQRVCKFYHGISFLRNNLATFWRCYTQSFITESS